MKGRMIKEIVACIFIDDDEDYVRSKLTSEMNLTPQCCQNL